MPTDQQKQGVEMHKLLWDQIQHDEKKRMDSLLNPFRKGDVVKIVDVLVDTMDSYKIKGKFIGKVFVVESTSKIDVQLKGIPYSGTAFQFGWYPLELKHFNPPKNEMLELRQKLNELDQRLCKIEKQK